MPLSRSGVSQLRAKLVRFYMVYGIPVAAIAAPLYPTFTRLTMIDPKKLEDLGNRLSALIAASPVADIDKNARALLASFFAKLDLVSREEFDVQTQVLVRTREKLKTLEERMAKLESPGCTDPLQ